VQQLTQQYPAAAADFSVMISSLVFGRRSFPKLCGFASCRAYPRDSAVTCAPYRFTLRGFAGPAAGQDEKTPIASWMEYLPEQQLVSAWKNFWRWYDKCLGDRRWPEAVDICTRGADFGVRIPQPELVLRPGIARGSSDWRLQTCGAALYWHLACVAAGRASVESDVKPLTGLDVLEVACLRGGGARYLATIAGPRSYVAIEGSMERVEGCRRRHAAEASDLLQFQHVSADALGEHFPANSFDLVISVEPGDRIGDSPHAFAAGVAHVLRPGGVLLLCDMLSSTALEEMQESFAAAGLQHESQNLNQPVKAAGIIAELPMGQTYWLLWAQRPDFQPE